MYKTFKALSLILLIACSVFIASCGKKETPKKITYNNCRIMSIKVLEVPANDPSGGGWDISNGPDVFVEVAVGGSTILNTTSNRFDNNTSYPIKWNLANPIQINNLNIQYDFYVYDYDSPDPDDLMGAMGYIFSNSSDYPANLVLTYQGTKLELELQWF